MIGPELLNTQWGSRRVMSEKKRERRAHRLDDEARARLVELHLPLAASLARRFASSAEPLEDLVQIATVGLLKAIDRFRPELGNPFPAFAVPTILGELQRHHRDRGWPVRIPRRLRENGLRVREAELPADGDGGGEVLLGGPDPHETTENRVLLASGYRILDERERLLVHLYYFAGLSQARIADDVQLSQIHVSRLLRGAVDKMRRELGAVPA